jgi:hypothetical protein
MGGQKLNRSYECDVNTWIGFCKLGDEHACFSRYRKLTTALVLYKGFWPIIS